ncbi:uncharacterized protein LOC144356687 [Saccoglossus kowalevskii]
MRKDDVPVYQTVTPYIASAVLVSTVYDNHYSVATSVPVSTVYNNHGSVATSVPASTVYDNQTSLPMECIESIKSTIHDNAYEFRSSNNSLPICKEELSLPDNVAYHEKTVVPNIAHYVWFGNLSFRFDHLISLLSAHRVMKATKIMFHTNCEPNGTFWEEAKLTIPTLEIKYRKPPKTIFGYSLEKSKVFHLTDIARLEVLLEYGGIYMDCDVIVVQSLEPLRHYDYVMGREDPTHLNNGILIARKDSLFLKMYYEGYRFYKRSCWGCDSILYPNALAIQFPGLIKIENKRLVQPNWDKTWQIFFGYYKWWRYHHYTIHTYIRVCPEMKGREINYNATNIKTLRTTFGALCRFIYYGSKSLILD